MQKFKQKKHRAPRNMDHVEFKIEEICDDRVSKKASTMGETEYHIKWVDFNSSENTWEVGTMFLCLFLFLFFFHVFEKMLRQNISNSHLFCIHIF